MSFQVRGTSVIFKLEEEEEGMEVVLLIKIASGTVLLTRISMEFLLLKTIYQVHCIFAFLAINSGKLVLLKL